MIATAIFGQKEKEVLGINRRNQNYIRAFNPPSARGKADNKLTTKKILNQVGIKTPELYKVIRSKQQLKFFDWNSLPKSYVIKPNRGSQGSGIIVFYGQKKNSLEWIRPSGQTMDPHEISLHMEKILDGRLSMGNRKDIVIIEDRIRTHSELKRYSYKGVPDIRLIVFNRVPIMAMVRLPTRRSDGKANLHAGAICAGIDIASGVTTNAMHLRKQPLIEDTYEDLEFTLDQNPPLPLRGIKIPFWEEILQIAVKCQEVSGLGYLGVDIVIDQEHGPMVLELNARPGLGIQTANKTGLRARLERVAGLQIKSNKHGIRVAKSLFGGEVEEEIEVISGKRVVNLVEKVNVYHSEHADKKELVSAMLDTGITTSRIDEGLASRLGFTDALKSFSEHKPPREFGSFTEAQQYIDAHEEEITSHPQILRLAKISEDGKINVKPVISLEIKVAGERRAMDFVVSTQSDMLYPVLIGRAELKSYLIDASKTFTR
ncbi:MAG: sugar-transfer associated ATP-grasp domain-containing protein [Candidatus Dojkabacteria bacterium]|nr:MAG: sugar-transfer associated ATP-grasp domain-containing protein [Candidatus Dojkabacteria bacterium]